MKLNLFLFAFCLLAFAACDLQDDSEEIVATQDIEIEVDYYTNTFDVDNKKSTISYRIHYKNPNNFAVKGNALASIEYKYKTETLVIKGSPKPKASSCPEIEANQTCTDEFFLETDLDTNLHNIDDLPEINLVDIEYFISEELR